MKPDQITRATVVGLSLLASTADPSAQSADEFFETRVRPGLVQKCYGCHATVSRGGLQVDSRDALLTGGASGPAIVPGDADNSLLIRVVRHEVADLEMPRDADPLTPREIEGLADWIRMGAPWPVATIADTVSGSGVGLTPSAQLFVDRVRPVLEQRCFSCHTDSERGGLRLDSRERVLRGGGRGPAIVPGDPEGSLLVAAVRHQRADLRMPRNADPLSDREIEGLVEWIRSGAEWADVTTPLAVARRVITDDDRAFWSFQPLSTPTVPTPLARGWARTDIDRFVMARLEKNGLTPVGQADRRQLIRRATFDLIGLPPTPREVEAFLGDIAPNAFEKVVDRLLASPHYGESWGRRWLDVTRYGEDDTRGLAEDRSGRERYQSAYVYRDWVVDAFNDDIPYDLSFSNS